MMLAALLAAAFAVCPAQGWHRQCVYDGDTFWLGREKIRLADIDTPEMDGRCAAERARAIEARGHLLALLNGGPVSVERVGTDAYGRTLALVSAGGARVGPQLVRARLARRWTVEVPRRRWSWC